MAPLGYSPLPKNLVQGGLLQSGKIPGHITGPNPSTLAGCANPTINSSGQLTLLLNAPYPSPCDKLGAPLNCTVVNGKAKSTGGGTRRLDAQPQLVGHHQHRHRARPDLADRPGHRHTGGSGGSVAGQVVNVASDSSSRAPLGVMTAIAIVIAIAAPPALGIWLRRRKLRVSR